jgi:hypothetical protein
MAEAALLFIARSCRYWLSGFADGRQVCQLFRQEIADAAQLPYQGIERIELTQ